MPKNIHVSYDAPEDGDECAGGAAHSPHHCEPGAPMMKSARTFPDGTEKPHLCLDAYHVIYGRELSADIGE